MGYINIIGVMTISLRLCIIVMFFLNGWDTGMAGEKMGGLQRVGMSFPNNGDTTCVILCSVVVELLFVLFYFNKVIEEHEIHAAMLLTEVPLTFGAAIT